MLENSAGEIDKTLNYDRIHTDCLWLIETDKSPCYGISKFVYIPVDIW